MLCKVHEKKYKEVILLKFAVLGKCFLESHPTTNPVCFCNFNSCGAVVNLELIVSEISISENSTKEGAFLAGNTFVKIKQKPTRLIFLV